LGADRASEAGQVVSQVVAPRNVNSPRCVAGEDLLAAEGGKAIAQAPDRGPARELRPLAGGWGQPVHCECYVAAFVSDRILSSTSFMRGRSISCSTCSYQFL